MQKEATIEKWKQLYAITFRIRALEPWNHFYESDVIAIWMLKRKEPTYCSIMGRLDGSHGIRCFDGESGLADFFSIMTAKSSKQPLDQLMYEQSNISVYFGSVNEVPKEQKRLIKEMGYKFRGDGNWVYFESHLKGYIPFIPNADEVELLLELYEQLEKAIQLYVNKEIMIAFERWNCLLRRYDRKKRIWVNEESPLPDAEKRNQRIALTDQKQQEKLKELSERKQSNKDLIFDMIYVGFALNDEDYDRPITQRAFVVMHSSGEIIIPLEFFGPDDDVVSKVLEYFSAYISCFGKIRRIWARNPYLLGILTETCEFLNIPVFTSGKKFQVVDNYWEKMNRQWNKIS